MIVTLNPAFTVDQKRSLHNWLINTLGNEELRCEYLTFPIPNDTLAIYVNDKVKVLRRGRWQEDLTTLYLGQGSLLDSAIDLKKRLCVLLCLSQLCDSSSELTNVCTKAITHYLLGEYQQLATHLVVAASTPEGIAFCSDSRTASLIGGEWLLASGEPVDVSGPEWTVCATEVPAIEAIQQLAETEAHAVPVAPQVFTTGQRVHWSGGSFGERDGVVESVPTPGRNFYNIRETEGLIWAAMAEELTPLIDPLSIEIGSQLVYLTQYSGSDSDELVTVRNVLGDNTVLFTFDDGSQDSAPAAHFRRP